MKKILGMIIILSFLFVYGLKSVNADEYQISQQRFIITLKNEILKNERHGSYFIKRVDDFFQKHGDNKERQKELFQFIYTKWEDLEFRRKDSIMAFMGHENPYSTEELLVRNMLMYIEIMLDRHSHNFELNTDDWQEKALGELGFNFKYPRGYSIGYSEYFSGNEISYEELLSFGGGSIKYLQNNYL